MKKLLILIMLAIMVTLVAVPLVASACGDCLEASVSTSFAPYGITAALDVSGGDKLIAAGAALGKHSYNDIAITLIDTGGEAAIVSASATTRKYHIQTASRAIETHARDRPELSAGNPIT